MDTFQLVARGLATHLGIDVSEITPELELMELCVDSLDSAELLMELETKLGVEIELTEKLSTVQDIVTAIDSAVKD